MAQATWSSVLGKDVGSGDAGEKGDDTSPGEKVLSSGSDTSPVLVQMAQAKEAVRQALGLRPDGGQEGKADGESQGGSSRRRGAGSWSGGAGDESAVTDSTGSSPKESCLVCEKVITKSQVKYSIRCPCGQIVVHANPKGKNCFTGSNGACAAVALAYGYAKPDCSADLDHPEVRVLLRAKLGFCLNDPTVIVGFVSWEGIQCPGCMHTSRTPLVSNLFNADRDSTSSDSDSDEEAGDAERDDEGEGAGIEGAVRTIDLTDAPAVESPRAIDLTAEDDTPVLCGDESDDDEEGSESEGEEDVLQSLRANVIRAAVVMAQVAKNGGRMGSEIEATSWGMLISACTRGVRAVATVMGWSKGQPLPLQAEPGLWVALSEALKAMSRDMRDMQGLQRDQGALRAPPGRTSHAPPPAEARPVAWSAGTEARASGVVAATARVSTAPAQKESRSKKAQSSRAQRTVSSSDDDGEAGARAREPRRVPPPPHTPSPPAARTERVGLRGAASSARAILLLLKGRSVCDTPGLYGLLHDELRVSDQLIQSLAEATLGWREDGTGLVRKDLSTFRELLGYQLPDDMRAEMAAEEPLALVGEG